MPAVKLESRRYLQNKYVAKCSHCGRYIEPGEEIFVNPFQRGPKGGIVPVHRTCENDFDAVNGTGEDTPQAEFNGAGTHESELREENAALRAELETLRKQVFEGGSRTLHITVNDAATGERKEFKKRTHVAFDTVLWYVEQIRRANRDRHASPFRALWLWGEHGSGKSYLCEQIAEVLGLPFRFESLNDQTTMSVITGTINPMTGEFRPTQSFESYKDGGLMVYEESASAGGNVWTQLGAAIAGDRWCHSNWGSIRKHPDFVPIFVDNTSGRGPTPAYPTRRRMDESTMSRCAVVKVGYDARLDREIASTLNPQAGAWIDWVMKVRRWIDENAVKSAVYVDPRSLHCFAYSLRTMPATMNVNELLEHLVWKDLPRDLKERIVTACPLPQGA